MGEGKLEMPYRKVILNHMELNVPGPDDVVMGVDFEFSLRAEDTSPGWEQVREAMQEAVAKMMDPKPMPRNTRLLECFCGEQPRGVQLAGDACHFVCDRCGVKGPVSCPPGKAQVFWNDMLRGRITKLMREEADRLCERVRGVAAVKAAFKKGVPPGVLFAHYEVPPAPVMCAHGKYIPCGQTECLCPPVEKPQESVIKAEKCCGAEPYRIDAPNHTGFILFRCAGPCRRQGPHAVRIRDARAGWNKMVKGPRCEFCTCTCCGGKS